MSYTVSSLGTVLIRKHIEEPIHDYFPHIPFSTKTPPLRWIAAARQLRSLTSSSSTSRARMPVTKCCSNRNTVKPDIRRNNDLTQSIETHNPIKHGDSIHRAVTEISRYRTQCRMCSITNMPTDLHMVGPLHHDVPQEFSHGQAFATISSNVSTLYTHLLSLLLIRRQRRRAQRHLHCRKENKIIML